MRSETIVFVHGMYMNPLCWEQWVDYYQAKGYKCLAPAWPGRDQPIDTLRKRHPDPQFGKLTLSGVLEHFTDTINALDEKPILIGHSMGGLAVQLLLQNRLGRRGRCDRFRTAHGRIHHQVVIFQIQLAAYYPIRLSK